MKAIFVFTETQYRSVHSHARDAVIMTCNPDVVYLCDKDGVECRDITASVDDADISDVESCVVQSVEAVDQCLAELLPRDIRHLSRHMAHELYMTLKQYRYVRHLVDYVCESISPAWVGLFGEQNRPFFWDPPCIAPDVANAAAQSVVRERRIAHHTFCESPSLSDDDISYLIDRDDGVISEMNRLQPSSIALLCRGGVGKSEMQSLMTRISQNPELCRILPVHWWRCFYDETNSRDLEGAVHRAFAQAALRNDLLASFSREFVVHATLTMWVRRILVALAYYRYGYAVANGLKSSVVVHGYDIMMQSRCFAEGVREGGAQPLSIWHGGLSSEDLFAHRHRHAVGHLAVWSHANLNTMLNERSTNFTIKPVGSLRCDFVDVRPPHHAKANQTSAKVILVLTSRLESFANSMLQIRENNLFWEDLYTLAKDWKDYKFIIKLHPRYNYRCFIHDHTRPPNVELSKAPLSVVLPEADVMLTANTNSTAVVESVLANVPVVCALQGLKPWIREKISETLSLVVPVYDADSMKQELHRILSDVDYSDEVCRRARTKLNAVLPWYGEEAGARLWSWAEEIAASKPNASTDSTRSELSLYMLNICRVIDCAIACGPSWRRTIQARRAAPKLRERCGWNSALPYFEYVVWAPRTQSRCSCTRMLLDLIVLIQPISTLSIRRALSFVEAALMFDKNDVRVPAYGRCAAGIILRIAAAVRHLVKPLVARSAL